MKKKKDLTDWWDSLPTIICQSNEDCAILRSKHDQCEFCGFHIMENMDVITKIVI